MTSQINQIPHDCPYFDLGCSHICRLNDETNFKYILQNAFKYGIKTDERGVDLSFGVDDASAYIKIRDYGPGVNKKDLNKIFIHNINIP